MALGCSFLSRSRSAHISSILFSIRSNRASAEAVGMPARCSWRISPRSVEVWHGHLANIGANREQAPAAKYWAFGVHSP
jgi:hypothetical protein